jgi:Na+-driven multidrug efflux pump
VYEWFIVNFIGAEYFVGLPFALLMALSGIVFGVHAILTSFLVGRNQPALETYSRVVTLVVMAGVGLTFIPQQGVMGAAWASLMSAVIGTLCYPLLLYGRRRLSARRAETPGHA